MAQQQQQVPPPEYRVPTAQEAINQRLQPYLPALETLSETELASQDKNFKHFLRWRKYWQERIDLDENFGDYQLKKQQYVLQPKSGLNGIGDWHELGPKKYPNSSILSNIGGGALGVGPVNWISFDPNFASTQLMFTGGWSTGLWYSENGGDNWLNGGTDQLMASVSTADCKSSHHNSDVWFLITGDGDGDGGNYKSRATSTGVYRTLNSGQDWTRIGTPTDLCGLLIWEWGEHNIWEWQLKHLLLDPTSTNSELGLYVTGTFGVYRTNNAMGQVAGVDETSAIGWQRILDDEHIPSTAQDGEGNIYNLYNIQGTDVNYPFIWAYDITWGYNHLGEIDVTKLYVSCHAAYRRTDTDGETQWLHVPYILSSADKGDTWSMIPNSSLPPLFKDLYKPVLRTVPSAPDKLYIHSVYAPNYKDGRIIRYDIPSGTADYDLNMTGFSNRPFGRQHQTGFAVNPFDADESFVTQGIDIQKYTSLQNDQKFKIDASGKFHVDVEDIEYSPQGDKVWLATHGGPFVLDLATNQWSEKINGIGNAEVDGFSTSPADPSRIYIGAYHDGSLYSSGTFEEGREPEWKTVLSGDGQETIIDFEDPLISYGSAQSSEARKNVNGWSASGTTSVGPGGTGSYYWAPSRELSPFDSKKLFVAKGDIFRHDNRGSNGSAWLQVSNVQNLHFIDNNNGSSDDVQVEGCNNIYPSDADPNLVFMLAIDSDNIRRGLFGCNKAIASESYSI